jgi:N-acetylmuramoyl-L-alanine amidase-like
VIYQSKDHTIYDDFIRFLCRDGERTRPVGELVLDVGKYFLGFPYLGNTLERKGRETLVINLRGFDCFTFVENVVALACLIREGGEVSFRDYAMQLRKIRYRDGLLKGYPSRLHYFSDWLHDNERKGILKNVTRGSGGGPFRKKFNFMTSHRGKYPALRMEKSYREMITIEKRLSRRIMHYIEKATLGKFDYIIEEGDLIAITTDIDGLDVVHIGIAVRLRSRIHLLHASEAENMVVISRVNLHQYLSKRKMMTGVMMGRLN